MRKTKKTILDELLPGFSERSRKGRRNRQKGAEYERDVAHAFQPLYPLAQREHGQARDGGEVPDVGGTPFWIECTKGEASIYDKLEQGLRDSAKYDARNGPSVIRHPVIVCARRNGKRTRHIVVMDRAQFIELLSLHEQSPLWSVFMRAFGGDGFGRKGKVRK